MDSQPPGGHEEDGCLLADGGGDLSAQAVMSRGDGQTRPEGTDEGIHSHRVGHRHGEGVGRF